MGRGDSFGQKKGENREFRYTPPRPYKRWEGGIPIYSPYQTKRYKSRWNRYKAGEELSQQESDQIKNESGQVVKYRFYSDRSNVGYWEVSRQSGQATGSKFKIACDYTMHEQYDFNHPVKGQSTAEWIVQLFDNSYGPVNTNFQLSEDYSHPGALIVQYQVVVYALRFTSLGSAAFAQIDNTDPLYATDPASHRTVYPEDISLFQPRSYYDFFVFEQNRRSTLQFYEGVACSPQVGADTCNEEYVFPAEMNYQVIPLDGDGNSSQGEWACNCPDYTKKENATIQSLWPSLQSDRAWEDSEAGAPDDCKHIIAAKFLAGEPPEPPDFDAIAPDEADLSYLKPWNPKRRQGDDFSADLTW